MLRELPPPSADHKTGHTKSLANPLPETSPNTQPLLFNMNIFTKINININIFTFTCKQSHHKLYFSSIQHVHFLQSEVSSPCIQLMFVLFSLYFPHLPVLIPFILPCLYQNTPHNIPASLSVFCHSKSRRKEFRQKSQSNCYICGIVQ